MVIIPDLFTPYMQGRELAIDANWNDLDQYNKVQQGQIKNAFDIATFSPLVNQEYNQDYSEQLLNYINTQLTPNALATDQMTFDMRRALFEDFLNAQRSGLQTQVAMDNATRNFLTNGGMTFMPKGSNLNITGGTPPANTGGTNTVTGEVSSDPINLTEVPTVEKKESLFPGANIAAAVGNALARNINQTWAINNSKEPVVRPEGQPIIGYGGGTGMAAYNEGPPAVPQTIPNVNGLGYSPQGNVNYSSFAPDSSTPIASNDQGNAFWRGVNALMNLGASDAQAYDGSVSLGQNAVNNIRDRGTAAVDDLRAWLLEGLGVNGAGALTRAQAANASTPAAPGSVVGIPTQQVQQAANYGDYATPVNQPMDLSKLQEGQGQVIIPPGAALDNPQLANIADGETVTFPSGVTATKLLNGYIVLQIG